VPVVRLPWIKGVGTWDGEENGPHTFIQSRAPNILNPALPGCSYSQTARVSVNAA